jgi:CheY-like chemotaxis protein
MKEALRVLIVDDNPMNIELVRFVLEADGFDVDSVTHASRATAQVRVFAPDLILMDMQMPDIDGLTLTRQLKSDPDLHRIPIVAFTAHAMKGDEAKMRAAGCDGYIAKPIEVSTLAAQIRALCRTDPELN